uniref:Uncharacterized protein n=1 Tax=Rhizophora mucronata TaxID=61149 RepID=A0A2P2R4J5_RHIMU
MFTDEDRLMGW